MSRTILLVGAAALALPLLSADRVLEAHDLRPRFSEGQELTIRSDIAITLGLDDATAQMNEMEMIPEVPTVDIEIEAVSELTETILAVTDGEISKMRRTHGEENFHVSGEAGMGGEFEDIDESEEGPMVGRTFELTAGEDGWEVEDVTDPELDTLEDGVLAMINERSHFEQMLPSDPIEVGGTWDLGAAMIDEITKAMSTAAASDPEMAPLMDIVETLKESFEFDAVGKLVSVDDGVAQLEWKITAELAIDDLFDMVRQVADPDLIGELPESAEGSIEVAIEMVGSGSFDLAAHQLVEATMEGEFAIAGEFGISEQGMEISASADASGTIEVNSSITVE